MKIINQLKKLNLDEPYHRSKNSRVAQFRILNMNICVFKNHSNISKPKRINVMITDNDNFESLVCFHINTSYSVKELYDIISAELIKQWPHVGPVL